MAKSATATVAVSMQGDGLTLQDGVVMTNAASAAPSSQALFSGNNSIVLPSGVLRVVVKPLPTNNVAWTLKGLAADTGISMNPAEPAFLSFAAGTVSFIINAAGTMTVVLDWC